jgi:hypothetical protein
MWYPTISLFCSGLVRTIDDEFTGLMASSIAPTNCFVSSRSCVAESCFRGSVTLFQLKFNEIRNNSVVQAKYLDVGTEHHCLHH